MAIYTSNTASAQLKGYFETGDVPTANNFIDLIDSFAIYDGTLPFISGSSTGTGSFGNLAVVGSVMSSLTPSKKDDAVVAKVKKALSGVEDEVKKVVKKAKAVKKAVKS